MVYEEPPSYGDDYRRVEHRVELHWRGPLDLWQLAPNQATTEPNECLEFFKSNAGLYLWQTKRSWLKKPQHLYVGQTRETFYERTRKHLGNRIWKSLQELDSRRQSPRVWAARIEALPLEGPRLRQSKLDRTKALVQSLEHGLILKLRPALNIAETRQSTIPWTVHLWNLGDKPPRLPRKMTLPQGTWFLDHDTDDEE
jgi:hypothetical protein